MTATPATHSRRAHSHRARGEAGLPNRRRTLYRGHRSAGLLCRARRARRPQLLRLAHHLRVPAQAPAACARSGRTRRLADVRSERPRPRTFRAAVHLHVRIRGSSAGAPRGERTSPFLAAGPPTRAGSGTAPHDARSRRRGLKRMAKKFWSGSYSPGAVPSFLGIVRARGRDPGWHHLRQRAPAHCPGKHAVWRWRIDLRGDPRRDVGNG